jgi:hypothetical protein
MQPSSSTGLGQACVQMYVVPAVGVLSLLAHRFLGGEAGPVRGPAGGGLAVAWIRSRPRKSC